jgi:hypothetical protein
MLFGRGYTRDVERESILKNPFFVFRPTRKDSSKWDGKYVGDILHGICSDAMKYEKLYEKSVSSLETYGTEFGTIKVNQKNSVPRMNYVIKVDSRIKEKILDQALSQSYYDYDKEDSWLSKAEGRDLGRQMALVQTGPAVLFSHGLYSLGTNLINGGNVETASVEMFLAGVAAFGLGLAVALRGPFADERLQAYIPKMRKSGKLKVEIE